MENFTLDRNFSLVPEYLDINHLIQEIMNYRGKFLHLQKAFLHCKHEEMFFSELNTSYKEHKHKLDRTYCYGKTLSEELAFEIGNINNKELHPTLKAMIENISRELRNNEQWKFIADDVKQYYELHNIDIWSLEYMDSKYRDIFKYTKEILDKFDILKQSFTYKIESNQMTVEEAFKSMTPHNISIQGNQNQIQTGSNNQQLVIQSQNIQTPEIFDNLKAFIEKIENVSEAEKNQFKIEIDDLKSNYSQPTFTSKYNTFMSNVSAHVTIGTALWQSGLMCLLSACLPT